MMVIFTPFIVLWGFWFWTIFLLESALLIYCLEEDKPGFAVVTTIIVLILISVWSDFFSFKWIFLHPGNIALLLLGYVVLGAIYSILKYFFYVTERTRKWDKAFNKFCEKNSLKINSIKELPENKERDAARYIEGELGYSSLPTFTDSTGKVVFWMAYWPWSFFWTMLNNPIRWMFEELKSALIGIYRRMYSKIIGERFDAMNKWKERN